MAGLIAAGLAGATEGLGVGVSKVGQQWSASIFEEEKQKAIGLREESLARLNNSSAMGRTQVTEEGATTRSKQNIDANAALQTAQQTFLGAQGSANRAVTREQIASQAKLANDHDQIALKIAQTGGSVHTDPATGNVMFVDKVGNASQMTDPNTGENLKIIPDLKPAAKAYLDHLKAIDVALVREETAAAQNGDDKAVARIAAQRAKVMGETMTVATTGMSGLVAQRAREAAQRRPTAEAIAYLKAHQDDDETVREFKETYPSVDPQKYLKKPAPKSKPAAPVGAQEPAGPSPAGMKPGGIAQRIMQLNLFGSGGPPSEDEEQPTLEP